MRGHASKAVGTEKDNIVTTINEILKRKGDRLFELPFADGDAGEKID